MRLHPNYIQTTVVGVITFTLYLSFYTYLQRLDDIDCECSKQRYLKFIRGYTFFALIYYPLKYIYIMFLRGDWPKIDNILRIPMRIIVCLSFVFMVTTFAYIWKIRNCTCSHDIRRDIGVVWSIIYAFLIGFALIFNV